MNKTSRRKFFKLAGFSAAGIVGISTSKLAFSNSMPLKEEEIEIGVATYGLRNLSAEQVVEAMQEMDLKKISIKSMHLPLEKSNEEIAQAISKFKNAGLDPYACGVVYMKSKEEINNTFRYAKAAGFRIIVAVPNYDLLDYVESKVKEYDIVIAIHNHGPDNLPYPTPQDVIDRVKNRDNRMGICMDMAHVARAGVDPVQAIKDCADRLYDIHLRDNSSPTKEGKGTRPGKGTLDIPGILKALKEIDYKGVYCIEYSHEPENPVPGTVETAGYLRGVYDAIEV